MSKQVSSMENASSTSDFITHLPGDVTDNILVRLTLREAVQTSVLSKKWRYKWITIPHLVFHRSALEQHKHLTGSEMLSIIYQVLLQHQGPISNFKLALPETESCAEIDRSISLLTQKNPENSLREFTLYTFNRSPYNIPSCIFYCLKMRHLRLEICALEPPPDFAGFSELTKIEFFSVELPDAFAENFVAKCPLLERLTLRLCTNIDRISFSAPNLKMLNYKGLLRSVCFKHTPALKWVRVDIGGRSKFEDAWEGNNYLQTFCYLRSLEYLEIGPLFMMILALVIVPNRLASDLTCLVTLTICGGITLGYPRHSSCLLCLIKSAPNLQKLSICLSLGETVDDDQVAAKLFLEAKGSMSSLKKLKDVVVLNFKDSRSVMELIKLLLAKSPVLETIHLRGLCDSTADKQCIVLQQIDEFPRASPCAKIIFLEPVKKSLGRIGQIKPYSTTRMHVFA